MEKGLGVVAEIEPLLMMRPPMGFWSFMTRKASRMHKNMPVKLVSTTPFHISKLNSGKGIAGVLTPALLNSKSTRPNVLTHCANKLATESSCVTSVGTAKTREPAFKALASSTTSSKLACLRPANTRLQPSCNKAMAVALPMPEPAPVTMAIFEFCVMAFVSC